MAGVGMQPATAIRHTHHAGKATTMGNGVSGSTNAPANQPTTAGRSGDTSQADAAAKAKFGESLKTIDLKIHGDPDRFKPCSAYDAGPDYTKPIPKATDHSPKIPDTRPFHDTTPSGSHVFGIEGKI
jgi:hypothetical protein